MIEITVSMFGDDQETRHLDVEGLKNIITRYCNDNELSLDGVFVEKHCIKNQQRICLYPQFTLMKGYFEDGRAQEKDISNIL